MWNEFDQLIEGTPDQLFIKLKEMKNLYLQLKSMNISDVNTDEIGRLKKSIDEIDNLIQNLQLNKNYLDNVCFDIKDFLTQIIDQIKNENFESAHTNLQFGVSGLIKRLCYETYVFVMAKSSKQRKKLFDNQFEFLDNIYSGKQILQNENYKYKASIIVYVYKNREFTQQCIESIYAHTPGIGDKYELIVRADGYDEDTNEYLDSLQIEKKFCYPKNVRLFDDVIDAAEGEYIFGVNNDIIVTENWIENLLQTLENGSKVGMVVPSANFAGNGQAVNGIVKQSDSVKQIEEKTKGLNKSDSAQWFEQDTLVNYLWGMPSRLVKSIMLDDLLFTGGFYTDIDLSMRIKRAGYRLIFVTDTFVFHHGSASYSEVSEDVFSQMENLFYEKYGFTSSGENFNGHLLDTSNQVVNSIKSSNKQDLKVLAIDDGIGSESLNVKRIASLNNKNVELTSVVHNEVYLPYVRASSQRSSKIIDEFDYKSILNEKFDFIIIPNFSQIPDNLSEYFYMLKGLLADDGSIISLVPNSSSLAILIGALKHKNLTRYKSHIESLKYTLIDIPEFERTLKNIDLISEREFVTSDESTSKLDKIINHFGIGDKKLYQTRRVIVRAFK